MMEELIAAVIADLEGQNWTGQPLTDDQKDLIRMAVQATAARYGTQPVFRFRTA